MIKMQKEVNMVMKDKFTTLNLKRARDAKQRKNYYFGYYLPKVEGMTSLVNRSSPAIKYN